jgi:hypothetical protein
MKEIPLTQGKVALVDDGDFPELSQYSWYAEKRNGTWYATTTVHLGKPNRKKNIRMHRYILKAPPGIPVDHRDRDGLNNQRHNIRLASYAGNNANARKKHSGKTSQYKGVCWRADTRKWMAYVGNRYIGCFTLETDAALAYDAKARELYGEFAKTNF